MVNGRPAWRLEERLRNSHPGELLRSEFLDPLRITPYGLAKSLRVPLARVTAILDGRRAITVDTAARLGRFFGTSPQFWLNLQTTYELREAQGSDLEAELAKIEPLRPRDQDLATA